MQEHRVGDGFGESVHPAPHVLVPFCRAHRFVEHGIKGLGKRGRGEEVSGTGTAEKNKTTSKADLNECNGKQKTNHGVKSVWGPDGFTLRENWYMGLIRLRSLMMKKRSDALSAAGR